MRSDGGSQRSIGGRLRHRLGRLGATTPRQADLGLLALRVWFGVALALVHGLGKIADLDGFQVQVARMGFAAPALLAPAVALVELLGGIMLALGIFTRAAAAAVLVTMLVAAFWVHADDPFTKKEFALAYGTVALALLLAGPGRLSLDAKIAGERG